MITSPSSQRTRFPSAISRLVLVCGWPTTRANRRSAPSSEIEGGNAKFDLNHPLAGKDLTFEVEIKSVEAAPENFVSEHEKRQHMKEQSKLLGGDQGESYR